MRCLQSLSLLDLAEAMEDSCARQVPVTTPATLPVRANDDAAPAVDGFGIDAVRFFDIDTRI